MSAMTTQLAPHVVDRPVVASCPRPVAGSEIHQVLTVHADTPVMVRLALLDAVDGVLRDRGASRVWIDPDPGPQLVVLAEWAHGMEHVV